MSPILIVLMWIALGLLASVLVVAALALSSQISREEGVEELTDTAEAEHLMRFPQQR